MYLYKCDICDYVQEPGDKFFHISETTKGCVSDRVDFDFCLKCYERFQNSENKEK